jgi:hypothetical protein
MSDTMTVKELAEVAGVSARTVQRAAVAIGITPEPRKPLKLNHSQAIQVMGSLRVKANRQVRQNDAGLRQNDALMSQNALLAKTLSEMMPAILKMADACVSMASHKSEQHHALPSPSRMSVAGYCGQRGIRCDRETATRHSRLAKALSEERGYEIAQIPDERWGHVNAYDVRILAEVIGQ